MEFLKSILKDRFTQLAFLILETSQIKKKSFLNISNLLLYLMIIFADFLAPYSSNYSNREMSYTPPSPIYTINEKGKFSLPYTYNYTREFDPNLMQTVYKLDRSSKYFIKPFAKGETYKFLGIISTDRHLFGVREGGNLYLLGTDINGRDVFSRILLGGRISLTIGFLALLIVFPIGLLYGGISGYVGGAVDNIMMRFAEAIMAIPSFYLLIILAAILPAGMTSIQRFCLILSAIN